MAQPPASRRPMCPLCERALGGCICRWVTPIAQPTEVLILQHPLEVQHAKNSAGLLQRSLSNCGILVGEALDEAALLAALEPSAYSVLLYPASDHARHAPGAMLDPARLADPAAVRLVVLDGTWRKSRKMLHLNPLLQSLPRLSLQGELDSRYAIRKAHKPGQLSTLEATCAALAQLQGDAPRYQPLLQAFDGFVAQQAALVPAHGRPAQPLL